MTHAEQALRGLVDSNEYIAGQDYLTVDECVGYLNDAEDKRAALTRLLVESHDAFCVTGAVMQDVGRQLGVWIPTPKDKNLAIVCLLDAWKDGDIPSWGEYVEGKTPRKQVARKPSKKSPKPRKARVSRATRHAMNQGNAHGGTYCKCPRCGCGGQERGTTCDRCSSWIS